VYRVTDKYVNAGKLCQEAGEDFIISEEDRSGRKSLNIGVKLTDPKIYGSILTNSKKDIHRLRVYMYILI